MSDSLFDTHCHFDFAEFDHQRDALWQQCLQVGIQGLLMPGVEPVQWQKCLGIASQYPGIVMAAGLHPWWVSDNSLPENDEWSRLLAAPACVAIGECGLDASIDTSFEYQVPVFEQHLRMAVDHALPVIIHVRKAHNEMLRLLKRYLPVKGGVIHGFTGSLELAREYWAMGFYVGVGGSITYPRAKKTRETIAHMPLESLLLETDAPDMPPYGLQGKANTPLSLTTIVAELSQLRGQAVSTISEQTTANALGLFF